MGLEVSVDGKIVGSGLCLSISSSFNSSAVSSQLLSAPPMCEVEIE